MQARLIVFPNLTRVGRSCMWYILTAKKVTAHLSWIGLEQCRKLRHYPLGIQHRYHNIPCSSASLLSLPIARCLTFNSRLHKTYIVHGQMIPHVYILAVALPVARIDPHCDIFRWYIDINETPCHCDADKANEPYCIYAGNVQDISMQQMAYHNTVLPSVIMNKPIQYQTK